MANALIPLANYTVASSDTQILFANIPTSVGGVSIKDLRIVITPTANEINDTNVTFNGSSSNISAMRLYAFGNSLAGNTYSSGAGLSYHTTSRAQAIWDVMDFSATNKNKMMLITETDTDRGYLAYKIARWASFDALTSITFTPTVAPSFFYSSGATFALYGVAA